MQTQESLFISSKNIDIIESIVIKPKHDTLTPMQINNLHSLIEAAPPGYCKTLLHKKSRWNKTMLSCIELPRIQPSPSLILQLKHVIPNALILITYRGALDSKKISDDLDSLTLARNLDLLFKTAKRNLAREE